MGELTQTRARSVVPGKWAWPRSRLGLWLCLAGWSLLLDTGLLKHRALAGPWAIVRAGIGDLRSGSLPSDIAASAARVLAGVLLGFAVGVAMGLFSGLQPARHEQLEPSLDFLRAIPPLLVFSALMLVFGYGEPARVLTIAWAALLVVSLHVSAAVASVHRERLRTLRAMRASPLQLLRWLYLYELLPACLLSLRQALAGGLVVTVVTEMLVGAAHGLGTRALSAQIAYDAPRLYGAMLITGALGHASSKAILWLEHRVLPWRKPAQT